MSTNPQHIHFIGIGGIGMSALARHYLHEGWQVSGSDSAESENTKRLITEGAAVVYTQTPENITPNIDLVVYSDGVTKETVGWQELEAARASGIETLSYFAALGQIANDYYLIAVAGTHGKTTTTAMLTDILEEASFDPSAIVGSLRTKTGSNYRAGKSKYLVVEADEYLRHFLYLKPDVLIINNIDFDHPDYFADLADVQAAFRALALTVPEAGVIIVNTTDPHLAPVVAAGLVCQVIDYRPDISLTLQLKQPGMHNRCNAAAATAAARFVGVDEATVTTALEHFAGTWRRFEYKGDVHGAPVYDDYAHNPQKVAAAIAGVRELHPDKQLIAVFQPHTFSRTKALFSEFVTALSTVDQLILLPIYAAREADDGTVSSRQLVDALTTAGTVAEYFETIPAAVLRVKELADTNSVVLCMGAGSVTNVATLALE